MGSILFRSRMEKGSVRNSQLIRASLLSGMAFSPKQTAPVRVTSYLLASTDSYTGRPTDWRKPNTD